MGLIERGQRALIRRQKETVGRTVTITRGAQTTTVVAWPGATLFALEQAEEGGATRQWGEADYLFAVADFAFGGTPAIPSRGDRITDPAVLDPVSGDPVTWELFTPTNEPTWRYDDRTRLVFRVHCRRVKV